MFFAYASFVVCVQTDNKHELINKKINQSDTSKLEKLIGKCGSVLDTSLELLDRVLERKDTAQTAEHHGVRLTSSPPPAGQTAEQLQLHNTV